MSHKAAIKANWKNAVRFYFTGTTYGELKQCVKDAIAKENKSYEDWKERKTNSFKDKVNSLINN